MSVVLPWWRSTLTFTFGSVSRALLWENIFDITAINDTQSGRLHRVNSAWSSDELRSFFGTYTEQERPCAHKHPRLSDLEQFVQNSLGIKTAAPSLKTTNYLLTCSSLFCTKWPVSGRHSSSSLLLPVSFHPSLYALFYSS